MTAAISLKEVRKISESNVTREIVERFNNAFEKHRPEDLDDLFGENCVLENTAPAPDGARYEGREACLAFWKGIASSADLVFKAEDISVMGDRGIIRWQLRWSEREADRIRGVNLMRVRDGKIIEGLGYVKGGLTFCSRTGDPLGWLPRGCNSVYQFRQRHDG